MSAFWKWYRFAPILGMLFATSCQIGQTATGTTTPIIDIPAFIQGFILQALAAYLF